LVAFCQVFDQDVTVHLPRIKNFDRDSIFYTNEHRETPVSLTPLHICYGGDEVTRAHYDSARSRDGSTPRSQNSPLLRPQDKIRNMLSNPSSHDPGTLLSNRSIRNSRSDLSSEIIQDFLQRSKREVETSLDQLGDKYRARSPSATSSQRSSSSKRSLDDDGEYVFRSSKRADRRKSTRRRVRMGNSVSEPDSELPPRLSMDSPTADTPPSTQGTEVSLDVSLPEYDHANVKTAVITLEDESTGFEKAARATKPPAKAPTRTSLSVATNKGQASETSSPRLMSVAERPKSTVRA
jgi:hypothetical protein